MRSLSFLMLCFLLLGLQIPQVSVSKVHFAVKLLPELYAGSSSTLGQPLSTTKNLHEKPSYGKIWKEKLNKMNPFHKQTDEDLIAALLAFFVGIWGAHKFYQGNKKAGFIMLGITLAGYGMYFGGYLTAAATIAAGTATTFPIAAGTVMVLGIILLMVTSIWAFVDFLRILTNMK